MSAKQVVQQSESHLEPDRRQLLGGIVAGSAALVASGAVVSFEEKVLAEKLENIEAKDVEIDSMSGASRTHTDWKKLSDLKEKMSVATIGGVKISRMIMGGNLVGGWAHARDLIYVSELVKAYHTREKIYATLKMGEACGINAYLGHSSHIHIFKDYWEKAGGTMNFIADCGNADGALQTIEMGAIAAYIQGETNDRLVREEKFDEIATFLERVRKEKVPAGLGGHRIETIKACVERGLIPDFWMKTIHHDQYWSRMADKNERDNVYCRKPEETIEFMATLKQPWIGFKTLAAGAIHPKEGFKYALESGADFLCVGMYDFQIVEDVNICMDILKSDIKRNRPWSFT
ncbi:MAG: hypothetical protein ACRCUY_02540 [Thermoguttaceae bacterium]